MPHPRVLRPGFERKDARGTLVEVLNQGPWHGIVVGTMRAGAVMGQHYHKETVAFFFIESGRAKVDTYHIESGARDSFALGDHEGVLFPVLETHAITFETESRYLLLKSRPYVPDAPDTYPYPVPSGGP